MLDAWTYVFHEHAGPSVLKRFLASWHENAARWVRGDERSDPSKGSDKRVKVSGRFESA